jgi:hypothetical protein
MDANATLAMAVARITRMMPPLDSSHWNNTIVGSSIAWVEINSARTVPASHWHSKPAWPPFLWRREQRFRPVG